MGSTCSGLCSGGKWWDRRRRDAQEMEGLQKGNLRKMCVSAELLKPNQALSWAMGQHMTYPCLCVSATVFLHKKSANCQERLHIVGDEVGQRPIILEDSASVQHNFICCAGLFRYHLVR